MSESTTPPNTTLPLPQTTPIKVNGATTLPFTTHNKYRIDTCTAMAAEIKKYLVGPMPVQQFLDDFFPISELPSLGDLPNFKPDHYHDVIKSKLESEAYDPFVSLITNELIIVSLTTVHQGVIIQGICSRTHLRQFIHLCGL